MVHLARIQRGIPSKAQIQCEARRHPPFIIEVSGKEEFAQIAAGVSLADQWRLDDARPPLQEAA